MKNNINPKKLLLSKWTSVTVNEKEKHFLVTRVHLQDGSAQKFGQVTIEAILTNSTKNIHWKSLKDRSLWLPGWL